jgi:hypothetical protein
MQVAYDDYRFQDGNDPYRTNIFPESNRVDDSPYQLIKGKVKRKPQPQPKPKPRPNPTPQNVSDKTESGKSNEKLYIGLLLGSTGIFLATLFYFLFIQNKKTRR